MCLVKVSCLLLVQYLHLVLCYENFQDVNMPLIQQFSYSQEPVWKKRVDDNTTALATANILPSTNVDETSLAFNSVFSNPVTKVIVTKLAYGYYVVQFLACLFGEYAICIAMSVINFVSFGLTVWGKLI